MRDSKSYEKHFKETFTKTLGQRYDESSRADKFTYWVFISIVFSLIIAAAVWTAF